MLASGFGVVSYARYRNETDSNVLFYERKVRILEEQWQITPK